MKSSPISMIKSMIWNVRGASNKKTSRRIRKLVKIHKLELIVLIEPKSHFTNVKILQNRLGFNDSMVQHEGKTWIMWKNQIQCSYIRCTTQTISVKIKHVHVQEEITLTAVYAKCTRIERIQLWQDLEDMKPNGNMLWLVGGDFNIISNDSEKNGGRRVNRQAQTEFNNAIDNCGLMDINCTGNKTTWCNNRGGRARIQAKLDRIMCNVNWINKFNNSQYKHLNRTYSDHAPMLLTVTQQRGSSSPFRFQNFWIKNEGFLNIVKETWNIQVSGNHLQQVGKKLKALKVRLIDWNKETYGNIFDRTIKAEKEVEEAEINYSVKNDESSLIYLKHTRAKLIKHLADEEDYWKQKAHINYLKDGDANTKFFHAVVKGRRTRNCIHRIKDDNGNWLDNMEDMNDHIIQFYTKQLSQEDNGIIPDHSVQHIPNLINPEDNEMLSEIPDNEEIKSAIWSLNKDSAAGPDGFNGQFYQTCWSIIHNDVELAVKEFFCGMDLPQTWTSNSIVLIPKTAKPDQCNNLRPISLSNFSQKIISKILATRVSKILPKIISHNQTGFVKGRNITDNVMLAQEMLQKLDSKTRGNNIAIKLDMAKAYDRVSWQFLIKVLRAFGFGERWIDMIWRSISNCFYSVIINGKSFGYFKSTRGLKQGDPLSPALFVIAAEVFSRGIQFQMENNKISNFTQPAGTKKVSHLAFADDVLVFCNAGKKSIKNLVNFIGDYQNLSGQLLNASKCTFVISKDARQQKINYIEQLTGFKRQDLPMKYLGCPIFPGRVKAHYFQDLINAIRGKVQGWSTNLLNQAGRLILIKHVLQSIPIHICAAIVPPQSVIHEIDKIMSRCFWSNTDTHSRKHWISWKIMCKQKKEGGLGLRSVQDVIKVQSLKLCWKLRTEQSLWANFMKDKYRREITGGQRVGKPSINWKRIKSVYEEAKLYMEENNNGINWKLSKDGKFSTKSTWNYIRNEEEQPQIFKFIWNRYTPNRVSIFMWRLAHKKLPIDDNIKKCGINLVSKCKCCKNHKEETDNHLFYSGETATRVWAYFTANLGIHARATNLPMVLNNWWLRANSKENEAAIFHCIPSLVCWEIWKGRNRAIYDETEMESKTIIKNIKKHFAEIILVNNTASFRSDLKEALTLIANTDSR